MESKIEELNKTIEELRDFIRDDCYCHMGHTMLYCEQNDEKLKELGIESHANSPRHIARREKWKKKQEEKELNKKYTLEILKGLS